MSEYKIGRGKIAREVPITKPVLLPPDGMQLRDFYGISPITGKREVLHMELVDVETGKIVPPDYESYADDWDPVIEEVSAVDYNPDTERYEPTDVIHIHLKKWLAQNRPNRPMKEEPVKKIDPLVSALRAIAGVDKDHASSDNDIGFSAYDTEFGHSLASRDTLSEKQIPYAKKMVWKYRKQLQEHFPEIWKDVEEEVKQ